MNNTIFPMRLFVPVLLVGCATPSPALQEWVEIAALADVNSGLLDSASTAPLPILERYHQCLRSSGMPHRVVLDQEDRPTYYLWVPGDRVEHARQSLTGDDRLKPDCLAAPQGRGVVARSSPWARALVAKTSGGSSARGTKVASVGDPT
jgi:hypothetical protein